MSSEPGQKIGLIRGFLIADTLWQAGADVDAINRLMKTPEFRGLLKSSDFIPTALRRKRMLPLLPKGPDDPRIDQFAHWFLDNFKEFTGCEDGTDLPALKEFFRSLPDKANGYLTGQLLAVGSPGIEYWEGYAIRKKAISHHSWNRVDGKVLDLSWFHGKSNPETLYLGVPVEIDFLKWCQASPHPVSYLFWAKQKQDGKV